MKVSLDWLKDYLSFTLPPLDQLVSQIGLQLGSVEAVEDLGKKYQGVVVVKVVECEPHPDADRLHVCKIDDGGKVADVARDEKGLVQVVCGAPNVRAGITAAWIPPGVVVPDSFGKEPLRIESREIRGQMSNGMLASSRELALSDDHEGILEIAKGVNPGQPFAEAYGLNDSVIDLENKMFTHRPDCFGILGIAREISGINDQAFKNPDWYRLDPERPAVDNPELKLAVKNEIPEVVPRFCVIAMDEVEVKPSPDWLQRRLNVMGVRPINNVVDLTNYYMLLTGQPIHAYDYDKVAALSGSDQTASLGVRYSKDGEKIKLLGGKEVELKAGTILITADEKPIGIGGVMGGSETEVDDDTKRLIIECASFDMYSVRRTSMAYGLFTDAATRFTKGQSPLQNIAVLAKLTDDVKELSGAKVASALVDDVHLPEDMLPRGSVHPPVEVELKFINDRLGLNLPIDTVKKLLENVQFKIEVVNDSELTISAPFWRTDIELAEDIVEEVGRLYGYDKLPQELPKRDLTPALADPLLAAKAAIRTSLAKFGANEVLSYSFVHGNLLEKTRQDKTQALQIANALSPDLQYYRLSLLPSLLEKVHPNIKLGYDEFALFEIGKTHTLERPLDENGLPVEDDILALVVAASDRTPKSGAAYYLAKKYLESLTREALDFKPIESDTPKFAIMQPYEIGRSAIVSLRSDGTFLGIIGEINDEAAAKLKVPKYCAAFEVDVAVLQSVLSRTREYTLLPKYPKVDQDISLKVPSGLSYQELYDFILAKINEAKPTNSLAEIRPLDIYQRNDDLDHKQMTFRLSIASYEKTLKAEEVNTLLDNVATQAAQKYEVVRL